MQFFIKLHKFIPLFGRGGMLIRLVGRVHSTCSKKLGAALVGTWMGRRQKMVLTHHIPSPKISIQLYTHTHANSLSAHTTHHYSTHHHDIPGAERHHHALRAHGLYVRNSLHVVH